MRRPHANLPTCCWLLALVVHLSCEPEIDTPTWEPLDYTGLTYNLQHPTGIVVNDSYEQTILIIEDSLGIKIDGDDKLIATLNILYVQMETVITALENSSGGEPNAEPNLEGKSLHGTTVYAKLSCIGPDIANPTKDFKDGVVWFESPTFKLKDALSSDFSLNGDAFLEFKDCVNERVVIRGACPSYLNDYYDHIAIDLDLTFTKDVGEEVLDAPVVLSRDSIKLFVDAAEYGTYTIELAPGVDTEFTLGTSQGFYTCSFGLSGISCGERQP